MPTSPIQSAICSGARWKVWPRMRDEDIQQYSDAAWCAAVGDTREETRHNFQDSLRAHFEALREMGGADSGAYLVKSGSVVKMRMWCRGAAAQNDIATVETAKAWAMQQSRAMAAASWSRVSRGSSRNADSVSRFRD